MKTKGVKLSTAKVSKGSTWREDPKVAKLKKRLTTFARESSDFFTDAKEKVFTAQRERVQSKRLTHRDVASRGQERLSNSIGHDKARRSTIVEIQIDALDRVAFMKDSLSLARRDIKGRFGGALQKEFGAITNQHDGIENHFASVVKAVKQGELLLKVIDLVVADLDKGQLSDKSLQKAADLIYHPARSD